MDILVIVRLPGDDILKCFLTKTRTTLTEESKKKVRRTLVPSYFLLPLLQYDRALMLVLTYHLFFQRLQVSERFKGIKHLGYYDFQMGNHGEECCANSSPFQ